MAVPDPRGGVFETLLAQHGLVVNADAHLERLVRSVRELYDVSVDVRALSRQLLDLADTVDGPQRVRLTFRPDLAEVELSAVELRQRPEAPWRLAPSELPGGLGRHKWVDRAALDALAGAPWTAETDPLLTDRGGHVLETGRGNVFVVVGEVVRTPRADGRILPGVVRSQVLDLLRGLGNRVSEVDLSLEDLGAADDVFVSNSIGGIRPVVECLGVGRWRPGHLVGQLRSDLEAAWRRPARDSDLR
jgi:para-aminobenzoate synthetase / 4-amino-4-deoxychorismate lyase